MSAGPAIRVEKLGKRYLMPAVRERYKTLRESVTRSVAAGLRRLGGAPARAAADHELWALRDVSFEVERGAVLGIIGVNGAGKSTLLKIISRITEPTEGVVELEGRVGSLLEVGTGFHPELTGRENVYLNAAILGLSRREIDRRFDEIVAFAEIERFLDLPVKHYSSGMYMRLAFSVAAHIESDVLLVDEVLAVGDAAFQAKCLGKMREVREGGRTVLFVSHNMPAVLKLCTRVLLLERGRFVAIGAPDEVARRYLHSDPSARGARGWDPADAPGDAVARLRSIAIRTEAGRAAAIFRVREPFTIEIEYEILRDELRPAAAFQLWDEDGTCVFVTVDCVNEEWGKKRRPLGLVRSTCRVPGDLLNSGHYTVMAVVCSWNPNVVHAEVREAISFEVVDARGGDGGARGDYDGDWPGVVRPLLQWDVEVNAAARPAAADGR